MAGEPFASSAELMDAWRPLTSTEAIRADLLLARASRRIRLRWPDVDARILAGTLDAEDVRDVVLEMVQSAMTAPTVGVSQETQTAGAFGHSVKYDNPSGRLYFTAAMLEVFDGLPATVRQGWLA